MISASVINVTSYLTKNLAVGLMTKKRNFHLSPWSRLYDLNEEAYCHLLKGDTLDQSYGSTLGNGHSKSYAN